MRNTKHYLIILVIFLFISAMPNYSAAKENLDQLGGHFEKIGCNYILEEPTSLAKSAKTKIQLVLLINKYNREKDNNCRSVLSVKKLQGVTLPLGVSSKVERNIIVKTHDTMGNLSNLESFLYSYLYVQWKDKKEKSNYVKNIIQPILKKAKSDVKYLKKYEKDVPQLKAFIEKEGQLEKLASAILKNKKSKDYKNYARIVKKLTEDSYVVFRLFEEF